MQLGPRWGLLSGNRALLLPQPHGFKLPSSAPPNPHSNESLLTPPLGSKRHLRLFMSKSERLVCPLVVGCVVAPKHRSVSYNPEPVNMTLFG